MQGWRDVFFMFDAGLLYGLVFLGGFLQALLMCMLLNTPQVERSIKWCSAVKSFSLHLDSFP